jgi:signal transduction histidine kinase/CheY-like chemotaxis protein
MSPTFRPRRRWLPYVVLAVMLAVTAAVTFYVRFSVRSRDRLRFQNAVQDIQISLEGRLESYLALLRATAGLFAGSEKVTRQEFAAFVGQLNLPQKYPGVQGIGFSIRVPASERAALEKHMAAEGLSGFHVWPEDPPRAEYHSITYLEPPDWRNLRAIGYDMFAEPVRQAAMKRAAETGLPAASGKVTLVQETETPPQAGFLIYVPVYRHGAPQSTAEERWAALDGFVYSPFRCDDLFQGVVDIERQGTLDLFVYDGTQPTEEALLHDSEPRQLAGTTRRSPRFVTQTSMDVVGDRDGRKWTLVFSSRPELGRGVEETLVPFVFLGGLLTSLALFAVTWLEIRARNDAEGVAAELRETEREREALLAREREARAEAQAANVAKDEFLATLSHEMRTPLNAVLGWTRMLRSGQLNAERTHHALEVIERNARSQAGLIEDLLDVSRIIAGKLRLNLRSVDLGAVVHATLDEMRHAAEIKHVELHDRIEATGRVMGDADRLRQVVMNLLSNAVKFTSAGGRIDVVLDRADSEMVLTVRDTGIGIDPVFLPQVFDRFRQADSTSTRTHGGMGLGLAIVRHLVELMGGSVQADSAGEGQGATFTVKLPLLPDVPITERLPDGQAVEPDDALRGLARNLLAGLQVLVVDDDEDSADMAENALKEAGAVVRRADSVQAALSALAEAPADLVISDLAMPDADGFELIRRIRSHPADRVRTMPAIALTAHARIPDRDKVLAAGFQLYLKKPIEILRLQSAVAWLSGRG